MMIIGNSHTRALRGGRALLEEPLRGRFKISGARGSFERTRFFESGPDGIFLKDAELGEAAASVCGEPVIRSGGEWGFYFGSTGRLFNHGKWDRYVSASLSPADTERQPISAGVLRAFVEVMHAHVVGFFEAAASAKVRFSVLLPPPPRRNNPAILNLGASPDQVLMIDQAARDLLKQKAIALGAPVIDAPSEAKDSNGFLKTEFCRGDPDGVDFYHTNADYGKLVLSQLAACELQA